MQMAVMHVQRMPTAGRRPRALGSDFNPCLELLVIHPQVIEAKVGGAAVQEQQVAVPDTERGRLARGRLPHDAGPRCPGEGRQVEDAEVVQALARCVATKDHHVPLAEHCGRLVARAGGGAAAVLPEPAQGLQVQRPYIVQALLVLHKLLVYQDAWPESTRRINASSCKNNVRTLVTARARNRPLVNGSRTPTNSRQHSANMENSR